MLQPEVNSHKSLLKHAKIFSLKDVAGIRNRCSPLRFVGDIVIDIENQTYFISPMKTENCSTFGMLQRYKNTLLHTIKSLENSRQENSLDTFSIYMHEILQKACHGDQKNFIDMYDFSLNDKILLKECLIHRSDVNEKSCISAAQFDPTVFNDSENLVPNKLNIISPSNTSSRSITKKDATRLLQFSARKNKITQYHTPDRLASLMSTCTDVLSEIDNMIARGVGSAKKPILSGRISITPSKLPRIVN